MCGVVPWVIRRLAAWITAWFATVRSGSFSIFSPLYSTSFERLNIRVLPCGHHFHSIPYCGNQRKRLMARTCFVRSTNFILDTVHHLVLENSTQQKVQIESNIRNLRRLSSSPHQVWILFWFLWNRSSAETFDFWWGVGVGLCMSYQRRLQHLQRTISSWTKTWHMKQAHPRLVNIALLHLTFYCYCQVSQLSLLISDPNFRLFSFPHHHNGISLRHYYYDNSSFNCRWHCLIKYFLVGSLIYGWLSLCRRGRFHSLWRHRGETFVIYFLPLRLLPLCYGFSRYFFSKNEAGRWNHESTATNENSRKLSFFSW